MDLLRALFYPGTSAPVGGDRATTLAFEGLDTGWALLAFVALSVGVWWIHGRWAGHASRRLRLGLSSIRLALVAGLLFAATRPVLVTTLVEDVRQRLLVLVDESASMAIADRRAAPADRARAALAAGRLAPDRPLPDDFAETTAPDRVSLLRDLAANDRLDLWPALDRRAELVFYRFGRDAAPASGPAADPALSASARARAFFADLAPSAPASALGESLRQVLDLHRGEPLAGAFVLTDGANNSGLDPVAAAAQADAEGVPVFLYGVGVTEPRDLAVLSLDAPRLGFVRERVVARARVQSAGYEGRSVTLALRDGVRVLAEQILVLPASGAVEAEFAFTPEQVGDLVLDAVAPELEDEASLANNRAQARLRVVDNRVKVFMIEQEPRWDYRYLLDFLQDDRRLGLRCVLLDGDPSLLTLPRTPFLAQLPADRAPLYESDIILLGDVDPQRLGRERMQLIRDWVDQAGGGLVFLGGPKFQPRAYLGTPLEPLLPVVPANVPPEAYAQIYPQPVVLQPTPAGLRSPLLRLADSEAENARLWRSFPGVRWTAPVARARPGAEVLLVDPTPAKAAAGAPLPVLARQRYGRGEVLYFGFNETYRWRSGVGGKHYARVWGQLLQALALERLAGASKQVQLRAERPDYELGDRVVISGQLYQPNFQPLLADTVPGAYALADATGSGPVSVPLKPIAGQPGHYRVEFTPAAAGRYRFSTTLDPSAFIEFEVRSPDLELAAPAMDFARLEAMAEASGGRALREENLHELPALLENQTGRVTSFKRLELAHSPVLLALLLALASAEWLLRRLRNLK